MDSLIRYLFGIERQASCPTCNNASWYCITGELYASWWCEFCWPGVTPPRKSLTALLRRRSYER